MMIVLANGALVAAAVLFLGRGMPGRGAYLLTAGALAFAGFSRLTVLAAIDASVLIVGFEQRYFLPVVVVVDVLAVWLLAEGLRLVCGAVVLALRHRTGPAPGEGARGWMTPRRRVVAVVSLTAAALLAVNLYLPGPLFEPDANGPIVGMVLSADDHAIAGGVWDMTRPDHRVRVAIYDGETLLATVVADQFGQQILDHKIGDGRHGFVYIFPARLKDGRVHEIRVCSAETGFLLRQGARRILFRPPAVPANPGSGGPGKGP
jgi:hypothetical protein